MGLAFLWRSSTKKTVRPTKADSAQLREEFEARKNAADELKRQRDAFARRAKTNVAAKRATGLSHADSLPTPVPSPGRGTKRLPRSSSYDPDVAKKAKKKESWAYSLLAVPHRVGWWGLKKAGKAAIFVGGLVCSDAAADG